MSHASPKTTDDKLRAAILSGFAADERTAHTNLRVGVLNGIAHLAGVVNSIETRLIAAELVEDIEGVRGVVNRIDAPGAPSPSRTIHLDLPADQAERKDNDKIPE